MRWMNNKCHRSEYRNRYPDRVRPLEGDDERIIGQDIKKNLKSIIEIKLTSCGLNSHQRDYNKPRDFIRK